MVGALESGEGYDDDTGAGHEVVDESFVGVYALGELCDAFA